MRGGDQRSCELFSCVDAEARPRRDHPLRALREIVNAELGALEADSAALYTPLGRPLLSPATSQTGTNRLLIFSRLGNPERT